MEPRVLYIEPYVGLDYRTIQSPKPVRAILHGLYHSGTACAEKCDTPRPDSLLFLQKRCQENGVFLFVTPMKRAAHEYASTYEFLKGGILPIYGTFAEMAYVKLLVAFSLFDAIEDVCTFMEQNIAGEIV
jgi:L-asparaginase